MIDNQNFKMAAGDYKDLTVSVTDSTGSNKVITGCAITWVVKANENDTTPLITKSVGSGITILPNPNDYKFTISLASADSTNIPQGVYYHEARLTDLSAKSEVVMRGRLLMKKRRN